MIKKLAFICLIFVLMSSCSFSNRCNHTAGHYKIGNSYTINGITYHPKYCSCYEEVGIASWYGIEDHGTITANGEVFNRHLISAAHKTLPLPCFVRVTNLENGRKLVIRVNDRGPFVEGRIIDLSEKAAQVLGLHKSGLAKVKVEYLRKRSEQLIQNTPHYKRQYEKEMQKRHPKQNNAESKGYVAFFVNAQVAKSAASKLRNQGIENVRLLFKNDQYCVKVS
ncbi:MULTISPECIES: septal ring lytic transglycosylase RlpA family protein [Wolbachia]|nr:MULTISPECIES: septal ring lytic transglycosylase RlpA family protein [Wolbachia]UYC23782.1 septal ring lytic transglycosylase RlpA family protein [Wolbachia endosymbiont of Aedes aegypti]QBB83872.1 septal ring lytic transglycosylase RlpA family protein [Wolbachia pipientis wAlbB]QDW08673.1 septal ring lytic transglycosylase RlpA family protein [Wolbachia pipientis]QDW09867.1 septal ring lytic transglycosylase RlpA family protein [Wolbachia pipientis]QZA82945.1 septal ring lytic transglycosy